MMAKTATNPIDISFRDLPGIAWQTPDLENLPELPLLQAQGLGFSYPLHRRWPWSEPEQRTVLQDISFTLHTGRSLGIVGASGAGKSTLARLVMALLQPTSGSIRLLGRTLHTLAPSALRQARRNMQMVFQDPYSCLDPRQRIERIITEPLRVLEPATQRAAQREQAAQVLAQVGLSSGDLDKYPHQFSGGQRQRIAIARALITRPLLIVADEPVSALDVSVQAQVLNLLIDLQQQHGLGYLLISHDLAVVQHLCDEVLVLDQGQVVERGTPQALFSDPHHPCTQALVQAVPQIDPGRARRRQTLRQRIANAVDDNPPTPRPAAGQVPPLL